MQVNIALLTVTDTRTFDNDKSGAILVKKIKEQNHNLVERKITQDGTSFVLVNIANLSISLNKTLSHSERKQKRSKNYPIREKRSFGNSK